MPTPGEIVSGAMISGFQQGQQRKEQLQDEQRQNEIANAYSGATTQEEKTAVLRDAYAKDPSKFKQFVENLGRRMVGKQPQQAPSPYAAPSTTNAVPEMPIGDSGVTLPAGAPVTVTGPAPRTRQEAFAGHAARGKTPEQQQTEAAQQKAQWDANFDRSQIAPDMQAKIDAIQSTLTRAKVDPKVIEDAVAAASGVPYRRPTADDQQRQDYQSMLASGQAPKGPDGNPLSYEAWKTYQATSGRLGATPAKPKNPLAQYVDLTAKKLLSDRKQGPPLTNEETAQLEAAGQGLTLAAKARANEMAAAQAQYGIYNAYDPETGSEQAVTRMQAVKAANSGNPMRPGVIGAPTGTDKKNQMLAQSAINQIDTMESILDDPNVDLAGPGAGQWTKFQQWLGSNSEDSQQFLAAATFASEHGVGVFGGRNIHSINDLQSLMGNLKTNPKALKAALEQMKDTMTPWANAGGRLPAPRTAGKTKKFTDNGVTYNIPADQVAAFKKDHPNAR